MAARPVYKLLCMQGRDTDQWSAAGVAILHDIGYVMHSGGHGSLLGDWERYLTPLIYSK
jgi:hypothetical protein